MVMSSNFADSKQGNEGKNHCPGGLGPGNPNPREKGIPVFSLNSAQDLLGN